MSGTESDQLADRAFQQLLCDAKIGSSEALGELLASHHDYLLWLANHELSSDVRAKCGASDIVQHTFLRAQEGFATFRGESQEQWQGWLRTILLNNLANLRRYYCQTEKRQVAREVPLGGEGSMQPRMIPLADGYSSPSSQLRHDEEVQHILAAVNDLPKDYRMVVKLRYWERLPFTEIGPHMGRSPEAARKLWARAFERLEKLLEPPDNESR